jgi:hypothetical protein
MPICPIVANEFFAACDQLQEALDSGDDEACATARARWRSAYLAYNSLPGDESTPFDEDDEQENEPEEE